MGKEQVITPAKSLSGEVAIPPDKSITHRAVLLSALAKGISTIHNPLEAEDCLSTLSCVEALGCKVERKKKTWIVHGRDLHGFKAPKKPLNCGNSGTTMRLLSGVLAAQPFTVELRGDESLSKRPMDRIAEPLQEMGASFDLKDGRYAPFKITGSKSLKPITWQSAIASAQVKSAVLLAGVHVSGETTFEEPVTSRDHTERMLQAAGGSVVRKGSAVTVHGPAHLQAREWHVPSDFSSAAFFLVAGLLVPDADIEMKAVNINATRTGLLTVLQLMGARIRLSNRQELGGEPVADLSVSHVSQLRALRMDSAIVPHLIDEIPILAVAATQAHGTTVLRGIEELRVKETDRIATIAKNLTTLGANVKEEKDGLIIEGSTRLKGGVCDSMGDHRIAMAMAIAGLIAAKDTTIQNAEAVAISYPTFWETLKKLRGS